MKKQNVQAEIEFFDRIADHDDSFSNAEYKKIFDVISDYLHGAVLEAGCSSGPFGERIMKIRPDVSITGIDINQKFITMAERRNVYHTLLCANLENPTLFPPESFDTVFCPFVIHHFPDIKITMENLYRWLKPGGYLIIADPNGSNLILKLSHLLRRILYRFTNIGKDKASINESHKSISAFKKNLKNYTIVTIITFDRDLNLKISSPNFSLMSWFVFIQKILLTLYRNLFFLKYRGSDLIIIAQKGAVSTPINNSQ